jgi:sugar lactone lactonase YvrE/thiol-disulfide isomerase/thioredoxin
VVADARVRAPELPGDLEWFNTIQPLTVSGQRGKVVLLDFWTYSCINCLHVLPDLRYLEEKYPADLTVIGIHSPKYPHERIADHLQKAINRYAIRHPVANDTAFRLWRQYAIRAWPSVALIDPEGYVVGVISGEGRRAQLDDLIRENLLVAERKGLRRPHSLAVGVRPEADAGPLSFPGKILATEECLYVSDTGHHRVLELDVSGVVRRSFGSGAAGLKDGMAEESTFRDPQGLVQVQDALFVADTGNHAVRRIDLRNGRVSTRAGTGAQGRERTTEFQDPLRTALNSPWDVAYRDGAVYIAMAGQHQVWRLDLVGNLLSAYAGSGIEDILDGPCQTAALAQPSGLTIEGDTLYIADSETSAIRALSLVTEEVATLVGQGLFEFGDADGIGRAARLQHPLGVAFDAARRCLWIADSYNDKLRALSLDTLEVSTLRTELRFREPGGLSVRNDTLWVADTNAHRITRVDLKDGAAHPLDIRA